MGERRLSRHVGRDVRAGPNSGVVHHSCVVVTSCRSQNKVSGMQENGSNALQRGFEKLQEGVINYECVLQMRDYLSHSASLLV